MAVRIGLSMALALAVAECLPSSHALSFIAPLCAAAISTGPPAPARALLPLPLLAWALTIAAGLLVQWLAGMPLALGVLLFGLLRFGFVLSLAPRLAVPSVLILIVFSVMPVLLIKQPGLAGDIAQWLAVNVATAVAAVLAVGVVLPAPPPTRREAAARAPPIPPAVAAGALLLAVFLAALTDPPAKGALLISVVLSLRAEAVVPGRVMRDRFGAALIGGGAAWAAWELLGLAPSLPVLFATVLLFAFWMARQSFTAGDDATMWLKSLNAFAILLGEGFSVLFEETEERLGIRIAGVAIGLAYGVVVLWLAGGPSAASTASAAASLGARPPGPERASRSAA